MSIADKITSIEGHLTDDYEGLENIGADLTNVNKNIQNIRTCLDNIYESLPKTTGEGSNLSLSTIKGRINVDDILGDTEQDKTNGYQLVDFSSGTISGTSTSISFTNNTLVVSNTSGTYNSVKYDITSLVKNNAGQTLKFSYKSVDFTNTKTASDTSNVVQLKVVASSTSYNLILRKDKVSQNYTIPSDTTDITSAELFIVSNNTATSQAGSTTIVEPMLQFGTTAHEYEKYTGGTASPNPTYPQDIEVVTGQQEVVVQNANILDTSEIKVVKNQSGDDRNGYYCKINTTGTYTLILNTTNTMYFGKSTNLESATTLIGSTNSTYTTNYTFNEGEYFIIWGTKTDTDKLMVALGSSLSYVEHQEQTKIVNLSSKNLLEGLEFGDINAQTGVEGTSTTVLRSTNYIPYDTSKTYYASVNNVRPAKILNLRFYNKSKQYIGYSTSQGSGSNFNLTTGSGVTTTDLIPKYFRIRSDISLGAFSSLTDENMISNYSSLTYEPYYNYELSKIGTYQDRIFESSGKNKCNITSTEGWVYSAGLPNNRDNSIITDNFDSNSIQYHSNTNAYLEVLTNQIQLKPNTQYTITFSRTSTATNNQFFIYNYASGYSINFRDNNQNVFEKTFTTDSNGIIVLGFGFGNVAGTAKVSNIMIVEGSTALPYEPYGSDKWYIEKNIGKYTINGASGSFSKPSTNRFNIDGALTDYLKAVNVIACMSDRYVCYAQKGSNADFNTLVANENFGLDLSSSTSGNTIRIKDTNYDDITQYKTWLGNNNVELLYVLATPTYTEITNTNLLNELNEIEKMMSYNGQTNISVSGNLPMILDVTALKGE